MSPGPPPQGRSRRGPRPRAGAADARHRRRPAPQLRVLRRPVAVRTQAGRRTDHRRARRGRRTAAVAHRPHGQRHLPGGRRGAGGAGDGRLRRGRGDRGAARGAHRLLPAPAADGPDRPAGGAGQSGRRHLLRLRRAGPGRPGHHRPAAARPQVTAARRVHLPPAAALHPAPQPQRPRPARRGVRPRLGGADRQARGRRLPAAPLDGLAEAEVRGRPGVRDRRLHRAGRLADRLRRAAARLPRRGRRAGLRGPGRHRLQRPGAALAARAAGRTRPAHTAVHRPRGPRRGAHWAEPVLVAQVAFTEWTRDGLLRHPRFLGLRDDKDPADVVRESPA